MLQLKSEEKHYNAEEAAQIMESKEIQDERISKKIKGPGEGGPIFE